MKPIDLTLNAAAAREFLTSLFKQRSQVIPSGTFYLESENILLAQLPRSRRMFMQNGSLTQKSRLEEPDVWEFRWLEKGPHGRRVCRKHVVGTVDQYSDDKAARGVVAGLIAEVNWSNQQTTPLKMAAAQQAMLLLRMVARLPPMLLAYKFPEAKSCNTRLSRLSSQPTNECIGPISPGEIYALVLNRLQYSSVVDPYGDLREILRREISHTKSSHQRGEPCL